MARASGGSGSGSTRRKPPGGAAPAAGSGEAGGGRVARLRAQAKQIGTLFRLTRQRDPKIVPAMLLAFLGPLVVGIVLGILIGPIALWIVLGVLAGALLALNVFGRRVQRSAYAEVDGKPGAAAGVVDRMRGDWRVTAPVQVDRNQNMVTRVVCRAGVVLIAEGRGRAPRELLGAEVRRVRRVIGDAPLHDMIIGSGEGETPLPKLQSTLMKKSRVLKKDDVESLDRRLKALGGVSIPVPKGPLPRSVPRGNKQR